MDTTQSTQYEIDALIASGAYKYPSHKNHHLVRKTVQEWFESKYLRNTSSKGQNTQKPHEIWYTLGHSVFIGEGNMSFVRSLVEQKIAHPKFMIATTYESKKQLAPQAKENKDYLLSKSVSVLHNIDATKLSETFTHNKFDSIIFQFPNTGSRESKYNKTSNHALIRKFLKEAHKILNNQGRVIISSVNTPYYDGMFQFEDAAKFAHFKIVEKIPFYPESFLFYEHKNTNADISSMDKYNNFKTLVFMPE